MDCLEGGGSREDAQPRGGGSREVICLEGGTLGG